jgi:hypothetical protein
MSRKGRPKKPGPRHPGGQLKREDSGITTSSLQRLRALGTNPLLETQVGRLAFLGELTETEAQTAFRIAEIYGRYERSIGRRRQVASPSYEMGRGRDAGIAESEEARERSQAAARAFGALQAEIRLCPRGVRGPLEELCVEDRAPPPGWLPAVKVALNMLARELGIQRRPKIEVLQSGKTDKKVTASGQQSVFAAIAANLANLDEASSAALYAHFRELYEEEKFQKARRERERFRTAKKPA